MMRAYNGTVWRVGLTALVLLLTACFGQEQASQSDLADCKAFCDKIASCNNPEDYGQDRLDACYADCDEMLAPGSTLRPDGRLIDCADELDCSAFAECVAAVTAQDETDQTDTATTTD